jgi:hypothetical protein
MLSAAVSPQSKVVRASKRAQQSVAQNPISTNTLSVSSTYGNVLASHFLVLTMHGLIIIRSAHYTERMRYLIRFADRTIL